jgi:hypothetical protein
MYINAIIDMQIDIINSIPNNLGNIKNIVINITNTKNIPIAFANVIGLIPKLSSLPHKFSINVFI